MVIKSFYSPSNLFTAETNLMELRKYWEIICRRKWILILTILFIPMFTMAILHSLSPIYQSQAKLMVKTSFSQNELIKGLPSALGRYNFTDQDKVIGTMVEILKSGPVVQKVIEEMNLKNEKGVFFVPKKFINPNLLRLNLFYKKGVGIKGIIDTETITVTGYSNDIHEAKDIALKVVKNSLDLFSMMYKEEIEKVINLLTSRIPDVQKRLAAAEEAFTHYQTSNQVYNLSTQTSTLISEISTLETELYRIDRNLRANQDGLIATKEALSKQPEYKEAETTIESNPLIEDSKKKLYDFEFTLAKLLTDKTPEHPDIKSLRNQIETLKTVIAKEIEKTFASLVIKRNTYYDTLISNYSNLEIDILKDLANRKAILGQVDVKKMELKEIPEKERKGNDLNRGVNNLKAVYSAYLENLEAAKSAREMNLSNVIVIQPPVLLKEQSDNLYFPPKNKSIHFIMALFMGTGCGLLLVFFLEYLDDSFWSVDEIETTFNQKVIGVVPRVRKANLQVDHFQVSPFVDGIHSFITKLRLLKSEEIGKIVSVVSPSKGEGKSTVASFIAITLAKEGRKTLLIDGNMRDPAIHQIFKLSNHTGFSDYLTGVSSERGIVFPTSLTNMEVILSGSDSVSNPQWYLTPEKFNQMMDTLASGYDMIVVDTPALEKSSDALVISQNADDVIVVLEQGKTSRRKVKRSIDILTMTNKRVHWYILNKVKS